MSGEDPRPPVPWATRAKTATVHAWRLATADLRAMPRIVIVGAQRSGTTSLHSWLCSHPDVAPLMVKEVHYFDGAYERSERWYRSRFPISPSRVHVEASPYMLYHPLAAGRAGRDLPESTRFVALLREPAERALSHYQFERLQGRESETFARALELEQSRLEGTEEAVLRGERSRPHRWYSYRSRGRYAGQLSRWFDAVGRERILIMESERMFDDPSATGELLSWLGLSPVSTPFPTLNATSEPSAADAEVRDHLRSEFEADNETVFALLGRRLWARPAT